VSSDVLHLCVRTPHGVALELDVLGARVPTPTGLVGLRPRGEPIVTAVESGLIVLRTAEGTRFVATAGGLLEADRTQAVCYTPFATVGEDADAMVEALDRALRTPDSEVAARRRLGELEERIAAELRGEGSGRRARHG